MSERARILVITGPGKGKTTAALGIALRSLAAGKRVLLTRFAKTRRSGEVDILGGLPGVSILSGSCGMTPPPNHPDFQKHAAEARRLFEETRSRAEEFDLLVMDELCGMTARNMVKEDEAVAFLASLRPDQTAVATGRGAGLKLIAAADTVSEVLSLKHGYAKGVHAQAGVEY